MTKDRRIKVAVLMGGVSSEREVSFHSGRGVAAALGTSGYEVFEAVVDEPNLSCLDGMDVDIAFVALHGAFGEDGQVQALLEEVGIPYTGSGPAASRAAMDKAVSKKKFCEAGVQTAPYRVLEGIPDEPEADEILSALGPRVVVKPSAQGSSIGVSIVYRDGFKEALGEALGFDARAIVEPYIEGRELTVGVIGDEALPIVELHPQDEFFDYDAKYEKGRTEYIVDPALPEEIARSVKSEALRAFECLGCRDLGRVDMMLSKDGGIYVFEVNTIPGFTETSLVPMAAAAAGRDFPALAKDLVEMALERFSAAEAA